MSIKESFIKTSGNQLILFNAHISQYKYSAMNEKDEYRDRVLLLHKKEIAKTIASMQTKGLTLIPTLVYINKSNLIKIEIALARGKKLYDKRKALKEKDLKKEINQIKKYGQ